MADDGAMFDYVAVDPAGRRVKGAVSAADDSDAFDRLRRDGLSPLRIRRRAKSRASGKPPAHRLTDRELSEMLADLAALLRAGSDIRTSLGVIGARAGRERVRAVCQELGTRIGGGAALDRSFAGVLEPKQAFLAALVAAGEAGGDLAGGLERGADMIETRLQLSEQMVSVLSYPLFVLVSAVLALGVILLFVVPSLEPLAEASGARPGLAMQILLGASRFLRTNLIPLGAGAGALAALTVLGARTGLLADLVEPLLLDGPARRTAGGLVYGSFAIALGDMLGAGASMSEALRLSVAAVRSRTARRRLEAVAPAVRQGRSLSEALGEVRGIPAAVLRLAVIGEASGALGPMLARAGRLEEKAAVRRIEAAGKIAGPALIVLLGGLIGLLMAGLLSGVSQLGNGALE